MIKGETGEPQAKVKWKLNFVLIAFIQKYVVVSSVSAYP